MWCSLTRFIGQRHPFLHRYGVWRLYICGSTLWRRGQTLRADAPVQVQRVLLSSLTSPGPETSSNVINEGAAEGLRFLQDEESCKRRALGRVAEALTDAAFASGRRRRQQQQQRESVVPGAQPLVDVLPWPLAHVLSFQRIHEIRTEAFADPFRLVEKHLNQLAESVLAAVAADHPVLRRAARYFFEVPGKRFRPAVVLLMAQATCLQSLGTISPAQLQLAMITEMIHTASLLHDDVIDESNMRRSTSTVNALFGNQLAVLAGDFLLARASVHLAQLRDCDVVELLSRVIEHLVQGEVLQLRHADGNQVAQGERGEEPVMWPTFTEYMRKTWYKTASLIANSCKAVTLLNPVSRSQPHIVQAASRYGDHLGLAFQLVDDAMDYSTPSRSMGKPAHKDLVQGTITAPVLLALEDPAKVDANELFRAWHARDNHRVAELVHEGLGVEKTLALAAEHARQASHALLAPAPFEGNVRRESALPSSPARDALLALCESVLDRQR